jgi:Sulfotransferase family
MYLYIMGRGHSGSTILDVLLGSSGSIESVGELLAGLSRADREICSCGMAMRDCDFWREVRSRVEAEGVSWEAVCGIAAAGAADVWRVWRAGRADPAMARRARLTEVLARAITTTAGKPHLLESSKTPAHGLLLLRHLPEARVIHLVRDPRHVLQSYVWRVRHREHLNARHHGLAGFSVPLYLAWMAASWTLGNLVCELMARAYPERVLRVRFEDLCARPAGELERIEGAFGLDLADLGSKAAGQEPLAVGHNIGGNHLRHSGSVRFDPAGGSRRPSLPRWLAAASLLLCGPLMGRYRYRLIDEAAAATRAEGGALKSGG